MKYPLILPKPHSIREMLRSSYIAIILGMAVPLILGIMIFVSFTWQYDQAIANVSRAASMRDEVGEKLRSELWEVISGRKSFAEGRQCDMIHQISQEFSEMSAHSSGNRYQYIQAGWRATATIQKYIGKLGEQIDSNAPVSTNESLYDDIISISDLTANMLSKYIDEEILRIAELNRHIRKLVGFFVLLMIGVLVLALRFAVKSYHSVEHSIREPILHLEEMAARIAQGDLSARVAPAEITELHRLTNDLNTMAQQLEKLICEQIENEKAIKKAELRTLQAQITPHFMYNTLETIVWLAEEGRNREVIDMTMAFTNFLRISLSRGQDYITVAREEEHIRSYLTIQSVRYGSRMSYDITIDEALKNCQMLKLMLQPLVENAIYHGIKAKRGRGFIRIIGRKEQGYILFAVEDTGIGMTEEKLQELTSGLRNPANAGGYGLRNVDQRLRLYYGAGLQIDSEYGKGTRVSFMLPCSDVVMEGEA